MALRPALSPEWPRKAVMPPLNRKAPVRVIQKSLSRSDGTEALGHRCFAIFEYPNSGNSSRCSPEIAS